MGGRQEVLEHRKAVKEITDAAIRGEAVIGQDDHGVNYMSAHGKRVLLSDIENRKAFDATHGKKPWEKPAAEKSVATEKSTEDRSR